MHRPTLFFLLLLFFCFPHFSCASELPQEIHEALYEAQESLKKNNPSKAEQILTDCIRRHPDNTGAQVFEMLGRAYYQQGNLRAAYGAWQKGLRLSPRSFSLCVNLGKAAYEQKKYREAGKLFEKAAGLDRAQSPEFLYRAAVSFYQGKSLRQSADILEKLLKRKNPHARWLRLYLSLSLETGNMKKAETLLARFLKQNPNDAQSWKLLAQVRMQTENYNSAAAALEIAQELEKPDRKDREELAELYLYINLPLRAMHLLEQVYGSSPSAGQCEKLARIAQQAHREDRALHFLDKAIAQHPAPQYYLEKGKIFYRQGQWHQAMQHLENCIRLDPDVSAARLLMGYCAMEKGEYENAQKHLNRALADEKYREQADSALVFIREIRSAE